MSNNYWGAFPEGHVTAGKPPANAKAGSTKSMKEKPAFPSVKLPGKTQPGRSTLGVKKLKIYPKSEGL